jgi:hypothetical protein
MQASHRDLAPAGPNEHAQSGGANGGLEMKRWMIGRGALTAVTLAAALAGAAPVWADCYDVVGCSDQNLFSNHYGYLSSYADGPTCDFLYQMRNRIYAQHGYCFKTPRGISEIGNDGCYINDQAAVPLSHIEHLNVATIQRAERAKACAQ